MNSLERNYRTLMSIYPDHYLEHRREEMLTTLLATARSGQQHPSIREAFDLLSSGLRVRAVSYGHSSRLAARTSAGLIAAGAAMALSTLMLTLHLTGSWSDQLPVLFAPIWVGVAALSTLYLLGRLQRPARWLLVAVAAAGVILGPAQALAQRTLMVAVTLFTVIVTVTPSLAKAAHRIATGVIAIVAGILGAVTVRGAMHQLPAADRHRQAFLIREAVNLPSTIVWLTTPCLVGLLLILWLKPAAAIAVGLVALPTTLAVFVLTGERELGTWRAQTLQIGITVGVIALAAWSIGTARTLRRPSDPTALREQLDATAAGGF